MEAKQQAAKQVTPDHIMQIGMGFWASKTLLSAVNLRLFTHLAEQPLTGDEIQARLGLHGRGKYDFLDALVALGFLNRTGLMENARYENSEEANTFLDMNKPSYVGGILEMSNNRLYPFWSHLEDALRTGLPQNETRHGGKSVFESIYEDEAGLREFVSAMGGFQAGNFMEFANRFDFSGCRTHCDVGGAGGDLACHIARANPHLKSSTYDLPQVAMIAQDNIAARGLEHQVTSQAGDFFNEDLPRADVITMGNILHDWGLEEKKTLIQKAYDALPEGGSFAAIETFIDNDRRENAFGMMMSLNMLIETEAGYDFSPADFEALTKDIGFRDLYQIPLTGPVSALVAVK